MDEVMTQVTLPDVPNHPNRLKFEGVLTRVDTPSDKAPSGARGHRVVLTKQAAKDAIHSLAGMAVDFKTGWDGHNAKQKCGIITHAVIRDNALFVHGYLFGRDFHHMVQEMQAHGDDALGMSYELADAHVQDMRSEVWHLTRATFTGAAILLRNKAAYRNTSFRLLPDEDETVIAASCSTRTQRHTRQDRAPATRRMSSEAPGTQRGEHKR